MPSISVDMRYYVRGFLPPAVRDELLERLGSGRNLLSYES